MALEFVSEILLPRLLAASVQSTLFVVVVWALCKSLPRLSASARAGLWWLVALQLVVGGQQQYRSPGTDQLRRIDRCRQAQVRRAAQAVRFGRQLQGVQQGPVLAGARVAQQASRGHITAQGTGNHETQAQQP